MRVATVLLTTFLAACSGGAPETKEIVIGQYGSLTGGAATFGLSTKNGIEIATEEQNAAGGIAGVPIRMVLEDDASKPEEAATTVSKLLSRDRPVAILGEVASSSSLAAAPLAQAAGVPMISPSSTSPKVTQVGDYIFRVCFIDPFQGTAAAQFAYNTKGVRTVAVLTDVKSDYSVGLAQYFKETFVSLGGTIIAEEAYSANDIDFKAQLTNIVSKNPDAIFVPGYYTETGLIARDARGGGYKGILLGGDGWDSEQLVGIGQDAIIGGFYTNHYSVDDPSPVVQDFIKKYQAKYGTKPDGLAALGYDSAKILYQSMTEVAKNPAHAAAFADRSAVPATEGARKAARAALRDELARVKNFPGVTGTITIDKDRNAEKPAVVVEVTKDGPRFVESISPGGSTAPAPTGTEGAAPADGAAAPAVAPAEAAAPPVEAVPAAAK
ncbi:MAG: ABC transporter substrate-binding protein [Pseudomonadota bacterium]|nr:ABC transporter substrate-binding protein [Pseudomonadota bacterium]